MFFDNEVLDVLARGSLLSFLALVWITLLVRVVGLRSFSKMTTVDFVMTVAMGSLLGGASQVVEWIDLVQILVAMVSLFVVQYGFARLRQSSDWFKDALQNKPVLLMKDGVILDDALRATRVARDDLLAKLREANAIDLTTVRAVILETTGDVSVLHGDLVDDVLLSDLKRLD